MFEIDKSILGLLFLNFKVLKTFTEFVGTEIYRVMIIITYISVFFNNLIYFELLMLNCST